MGSLTAVTALACESAQVSSLTFSASWQRVG